MFGEDKEKARDMAREIIDAVQDRLQESERAQAAPMEEEGMSKEMRERIEADAEAAARTGFPGIPLKPTAEYGAGRALCRNVVLKFCELTAYLMGSDVEAMRQACERARREDDPEES
eukprot:3861445-Alexandrium_andersonii.AAC.1